MFLTENTAIIMQRAVPGYTHARCRVPLKVFASLRLFLRHFDPKILLFLDLEKIILYYLYKK